MKETLVLLQEAEKDTVHRIYERIDELDAQYLSLSETLNTHNFKLTLGMQKLEASIDQQNISLQGYMLNKTECLGRIESQISALAQRVSNNDLAKVLYGERLRMVYTVGGILVAFLVGFFRDKIF